MNHAEKRPEDTVRRLKRLYTAAVYDIMEEMGLPNQCLDLGIKPLDRSMRIAGPAFTIACAADARRDHEPRGDAGDSRERDHEQAEGDHGEHH